MTLSLQEKQFRAGTALGKLVAFTKESDIRAISERDFIEYRHTWEMSDCHIIASVFLPLKAWINPIIVINSDSVKHNPLYLAVLNNDDWEIIISNWIEEIERRRKDKPLLLPCPWCAEPAELHEWGIGRKSFVQCSNSSCRASGPWRKEEAEAATAWNQIVSMLSLNDWMSLHNSD